MRPVRLLTAVILALFALLSTMPALAAEPLSVEGRIQVSVSGDYALPAGQTADVVVVVDGDALIEGDARVVTVVSGTVTVAAGATVDTLAVVKGTAIIEAGATITHDVLELDSSVTVDPAATVGGQVRSMAVDLAGIGVALGILGFLAWLAFMMVTWAAGLALAAFGSRQVRKAEWLISREPVPTFLAGLGMVILPPIVAVLLMATVVLMPVGLALLLVVWPMLAFLGWLVGSTWIGEWILRVAGRDAPERRPYLGVTLGLIVATLLSLVPLVGAIIALFGTGAVTRAGWRTLRSPEPPPIAPMAPMPPFPPMPPMPPAGYPPYGG